MKKKARNGASASDGAPPSAITDDRFASMNSDPRFQKVPVNRNKVEIDSRFDRAFTDPRFASFSAPVDKRGKRRKKRESDSSLKSYYSVVEEQKEKKKKEEDSESESEPESVEVRKSVALEESEPSESEEDVSEASVSDATSDTDEDEDDGIIYSLEDEDEAPEEEVPGIDKETHRLAVVNMDWRYVKAIDLYMMLNSFIPRSGQILSVATYPSEFGLERMKEEEIHGPVGLIDDNSKKNKGKDGDDGEGDEEEDEEIENEKLRAYEKSKLRYYFAAVECDSVATADYLYKACDGVEFEQSSNVLDLRFIPDSMEFKHPPRDVAKEAPSNYAGLEFQTQALQQTKINLSWDEDEPDRVKTLKRKFNAEQLEELELNEFLASVSESDESESDEDEEDNAGKDNKVDKKQKKRDLYRALLESGPSGDASDGDGEGEDNDDAARDMEVTFNTGLEDISKRILEKKDRKQESVWEAHLREKRERKKIRKHRSKDSSDDESSDYDQEQVEEPDDFFIEDPEEKKPKKSKGKSSKREKQEDKSTNVECEVTKEELELLLADDTAAEKGIKGYNMKRKKVKGKDGKKVKQDLEEDELPPVVDDPRFSKLFDSPEFALDPTNPQFKRSATYARQIAKRKQKLDEESGERNDVVPAKVLDQVNSSDRVNRDKAKLALSADVMSLQMRLQQSKAPARICSMPQSNKDETSGKKMKKKKNKNKKIRSQ